MKKNIIFDLDGTLIDSMPVWNNVSRDFLLNHGITPPDNLDEIFKSMSFEESAKYFKNELGLQITPQQMIAEIVSMVKARYETDIPLKPKAYEFLQKQYNKGTKMCILTASEKDYVLPALKRLNIHKFFTDVYTCTQLGMSKSKSDIYDFVAKKMGANKAETAVFEDALHAVINAKAAGFYTVAIEDEAAKNDKEKIKGTADLYAVDYIELI